MIVTAVPMASLILAIGGKGLPSKVRTQKKQGQSLVFDLLFVFDQATLLWLIFILRRCVIVDFSRRSVDD